MIEVSIPFNANTKTSPAGKLLKESGTKSQKTFQIDPGYVLHMLPLLRAQLYFLVHVWPFMETTYICFLVEMIYGYIRVYPQIISISNLLLRVRP